MLFFLKKIEKLWYAPKPCLCLWLLWPFAKLYSWLVWARRLLYKHNIFASYKLNTPTIVVGNITVGGTGKTPVVIYLAELLKEYGLKPGIISRGYQGQGKQITAVTANSDPKRVGDEPVLIAKRTSCPVVVGTNKVAAGRYLLRNFSVDIVISDDGLQHYALARDIEVAVIDGIRRFGHGYCLPMGPLRELPTRLALVDLLVTNGGVALAGEFGMQLSTGLAYNLADKNNSCPLAALSATKVHAIAGICDPNKFFIYLKANGLDIIPHAFSDHHNFKPTDLNFADHAPVIMTEKDAVKCQYFAKSNFWVVPIKAILPLNFDKLLLELVSSHIELD